MTAYNLTQIGYNTTNLLDVFQNVATNSHGLFGTIVLFMIFLVLWKNDINGWIASSFITSVLGFIMLFLGLVTWSVVIIPLFALLISVMIYFYN